MYTNTTTAISTHTHALYLPVVLKADEALLTVRTATACAADVDELSADDAAALAGLRRIATSGAAGSGAHSENRARGCDGEEKACAPPLAQMTREAAANGAHNAEGSAVKANVSARVLNRPRPTSFSCA